MRGTAARPVFAALALAAATSAVADDARQAACVQSGATLEEVVACLGAPAGVEVPSAGRDCETAQSGPFVTPLQGRLVVRFGERTMHGALSKGVGLLGKPAAAVLAPARGIVVYAGPYRSYGNLVVLEAGCELRFVLAGFENMAVARGSAVSAGQLLGYLPAGSARVLTVGLHKSGKRVDPGPDISGR